MECEEVKKNRKQKIKTVISKMHVKEDTLKRFEILKIVITIPNEDQQCIDDIKNMRNYVVNNEINMIKTMNIKNVSFLLKKIRFL